MLDGFGKELSEGDEVILTWRGTCGLLKGKVLSFTSKMVNTSLGLKHPDHLIKINTQGVPKDSLLITCKRYEELQERDEHLSQLEALGVDNWEGYQWYRPDGFCEECMCDECECEVANE